MSWNVVPLPLPEPLAEAVRQAQECERLALRIAAVAAEDVGMREVVARVQPVAQAVLHAPPLEVYRDVHWLIVSRGLTIDEALKRVAP